MIKPEKVLYTAHATSTGGREGTSKSDDGVLDLKLTTPKGLGGNGAVGTNPEQLFAAGYSACFIGAMKFVAGQQKVAPARRHVDQRRRRHRPDPAGLRHPGRAARVDPGDGQGAGEEDRRRRAPGLPVLERDPRQHRGDARRRLGGRRPASCGGSATARSRVRISSTRALTGVRSPAAASTSPSPAAIDPSRQRVLRSTATPRARALSSACSRRRWSVPLPVAATTIPATPPCDEQIDGAAVGAGDAVTISTHGHAAGSSGKVARPIEEASAGQARKGLTVPATTCASGPCSPDENASSRDGCNLRTARAEWTWPARTTTTPGSACAATDDRVGQVARPVGLARRRRAHRRGQDDGLGRIDDARQEIRRLLERVGAVRDDDAAHFRPRQVARRPPRRAGARSRSPCPCCRPAPPARSR